MLLIRYEVFFSEESLEQSIYLSIYLLTYMGVFGLGQKTPPSLDGFSDSCIDGVP